MVFISHLPSISDEIHESTLSGLIIFSKNVKIIFGIC